MQVKYVKKESEMNSQFIRYLLNSLCILYPLAKHTSGFINTAWNEISLHPIIMCYAFYCSTSRVDVTRAASEGVLLPALPGSETELWYGGRAGEARINSLYSTLYSSTSCVHVARAATEGVLFAPLPGPQTELWHGGLKLVIIHCIILFLQHKVVSMLREPRLKVFYSPPLPGPQTELWHGGGVRETRVPETVARPGVYIWQRPRVPEDAGRNRTLYVTRVRAGQTILSCELMLQVKWLIYSFSSLTWVIRAYKK